MAKRKSSTTKHEYLVAIGRFGLTDTWSDAGIVGDMIGVTQRHAWRWARGDTPVPTRVMKLLRLAKETGRTAIHIERL